MTATVPGQATAIAAALRPVTLPLSEVFGPTWQGEGPHTGRVCAFVRLGLCNLSCYWCDTPYTWDTVRYDVKAECPDTPIRDIYDQLEAIGAPLVIVSGGEPLMHHHKLPRLLNGAPWDWHIETNGTIPPPAWLPDLVQHTTVSPKVATNDMIKRRLKPKALRAWTELARDDRAAFKFVVRDVADIEAVDQVVHTYGIPRHTVWIMPEGVIPLAVLVTHRNIADAVLERGYNTTTRLHTLLWGTERGH